jgi:hypothetical protein
MKRLQKLLLKVFIAAIFSCLMANPVWSQHNQAGKTTMVHDTVPSLAGVKKKAVVLKLSEKSYYTMQRITPAAIVYGEGERAKLVHGISAPPVSATAPFYPGAVACSADEFAGVDRAIAKTHLTTSPVKTFHNIDKFFSSGLLISDNQMMHHQPAIDKSPQSPRVKEELFDIIVDTAYIYGLYREADNDFHMIIGNGKKGAAMKLLNVEIAGLPNTGNELKAVRDTIIGKFGNLACGDGAFKPVGKFIPISVEGSFFYDIDHQPGLVGFGLYKPKTAWEIHPVKRIVFLKK